MLFTNIQTQSETEKRAYHRAVQFGVARPTAGKVSTCASLTIAGFTLGAKSGQLHRINLSPLTSLALRFTMLESIGGSVLQQRVL